MTVNDITRQLVRQRANSLCEYCHSPEWLSADRFTLDHLEPKSLGGSDNPNNLVLACRRCNERRYNFRVGIDPQTQQERPLFNPRQQQWAEHFIWIADGLKILAISPTGRATCSRLDLNDECHSDGFIQEVRQFWVQAGWRPPTEDPCQDE